MRVKGSALKARLQFARERAGDAGYAKLVTALAPGTRALVEDGVTANEWYPFDCFVNLCEVADAQLGKGDLALCLEMGRYACDVNLTTLYRLLFKVGSVSFIIKRAPVAWRTTYDTGELRVVQDEPGYVRLRVENWPQPRRAHCLSILGWMLRAAEISGAKTVSSEEKCRALGDADCEFSMRWTE